MWLSLESEQDRRDYTQGPHDQVLQSGIPSFPSLALTQIRVALASYPRPQKTDIPHSGDIPSFSLENCLLFDPAQTSQDAV